jgi:hypothetical protein
VFEQRQPRGNRRRSDESYPARAEVRPVYGIDAEPGAYSVVVTYERPDGDVVRTVRRFGNAQEARGFAKKALSAYHPTSYRGKP